MNTIAKVFLLVVGPILALSAGALGVQLIEETFLGALLLLLGVSYPLGAVIYYQHRLNRPQQ